MVVDKLMSVTMPCQDLIHAFSEEQRLLLLRADEDSERLKAVLSRNAICSNHCKKKGNV